MKVFLKERAFLCLVLYVFVALKIPHLNYPFYWDESWPYASAINAMYEHGPSLMPDAVKTDLSRGHPLFFHFLVACWMNVFGSSHIAMHACALAIAVLFLTTIFEVGIRLFNQRVAVMAILLVATVDVFFVQAAFLLPEIMVAYLCFLSLYCYVRDKYILTALSLTALFFTKESGMVLGMVLGLHALIGLLYKGADRRAGLRSVVAILVPCVLIGIFFMVQKRINGWYIFPFHADNINLDWKTFWFKFRMFVVTDTFYRDPRYILFLLLAVIGIVAAVKNKKARFLLVLIPVVFIYYFVDDLRAGRMLPSVLFFILFAVSWLWCGYALGRLLEHKAQRSFVFLISVFILVYLSFCTINFYVYRYSLVAIVPLLFVLAVLIDLFVSHSYRVLYYVSLLAIGIVGYFTFSTHMGIGDADLGAFDAMQVEQAVVNYLEDSGYYNVPVTAGGYLDVVHLTDPETGFLKSKKAFRRVHWDFDDSTGLILFSNIESDYRYNNKENWGDFRLVYRVEKGKVWSEVYKRNNH